MLTADRISYSLFIEYECLVFSLGTSPPSAALWWNSGVRQSQKQRKRSKSSTSDESSSNLKGTEGNARDVTSDERKDKEAAPAWYVPLLSFIYLFIYCTSFFTVIHCDLAKIKRMLTKFTNLLFLVVCWFKYTFCLKHETHPTVFRLHKHEVRVSFLDFKKKSISTCVMFIFPSKLKLILSRVLLNLKTITKIRFLLYFSHRLLITGAYFFQRPFLRGIYTEGSLRFKIG